MRVISTFPSPLLLRHPCPISACSTGELTTKSAPTTDSPLYGFCVAHSNCGTRQFCGNKCWTGQCGPDANIGMWSVGQFCQPCGECLLHSRSLTGSCNVCKLTGKDKCALNQMRFELRAVMSLVIHFNHQSHCCICTPFNWSMFVFSTGKATTKSKSVQTTDSASYGFCVTHSDCRTRQFCGIKCWTGNCGPDENIGMWTIGQFCQPCGECFQDLRSATGSCNVCKSSGKGRHAYWFCVC